MADMFLEVEQIMSMTLMAIVMFALLIYVKYAQRSSTHG